jgi:hypothetical protein
VTVSSTGFSVMSHTDTRTSTSSDTLLLNSVLLNTFQFYCVFACIIEYIKYCSMQYRCYATIARMNMCCLVTACEHVNNIRAIARQPPITTIEGILEATFSVGSASRLYSEGLKMAE